MLIDMHVHSKEGSSCSDLSIVETIRILKEKGFDGMLITDHESESGYKAYLEQGINASDFIVLKGLEVMTRHGDLIVILPNHETVLDIEDVVNQCIQPLELIDKVHALGGVVGIPHMYRDKYYCIGTNIKDEKLLNEVLNSVDFIETYNGRASNDENKRAEEMATQYKKTRIQGSDSHTKKEVGVCGSTFKIRINSEQDIIDAIKNNLVT